MPNGNHSNPYQEIKIKTATPIVLVVLLYDAAIESLHKAREYLLSGDIAGRVYHINKATAFVTELQANLNFEAGGDIARSLDLLYNYVRDRVFQANLEQIDAPLQEAIKLLSQLRTAWTEVAQEEIRNNRQQANGAQAKTKEAALTITAGSDEVHLASLNVTA